MAPDPITISLLRFLKPDGRIDPKEVLTAITGTPGDPVHRALDWNNERCGEIVRLQQIRELIATRVQYLSPLREPVRVFVSLSTDRVNGGGYRELTAVLKNPSQREQLLADALAELEAIQRRYQSLKELAAVFSEISKAAALSDGPKRKKRR